MVRGGFLHMENCSLTRVRERIEIATFDGELLRSFLFGMTWMTLGILEFQVHHLRGFLQFHMIHGYRQELRNGRCIIP